MLVPLAVVACETARRPAPLGPVSIPTSDSSPPKALRWRRGLNLGNALDAPHEGDWGVKLAASDFVSAKQAGFDHVGLPVRFSAHAAASAPYAIEPDFLARVDWALDQALANGLAIVVGFHHYEELMEAPDAQRARFVAIWHELAEHMRSRPPTVAFELCTEPTDKITAGQWNAMMTEALGVVRASSPTRTVVLEGVFWASAQNLRDTVRIPLDDPFVVGSFRMFQPILFTHQGAEYMPAEYDTRGIVFPGPPSAPLEPGPGARAKSWARDWIARYNTEPPATNPSGLTAIVAQLDMAKAFADRTHRLVYMGGFATIDNADPKSREEWTRATRTEAERRGFGWAYWDDGGKFKVYDRDSRTWNEALKAALLQ
jgi:endoglucanase